MKTSRRELLKAGVPAAAMLYAQAASAGTTKYVRFTKDRKTAFGIIEGDAIRELEGSLFGANRRTEAKHRVADVKLLYPCQPSKILAVGRNYRSHIGERQAPTQPEMFYKPVSALRNPEEPIVIPETANNVHYEGEMVIVVGKRCKDVSEAQAREAIFGVTCGNDVSERDWQNGPQKDMQWWRAKGADTFAPLGPYIVRGLDYDNLLLQTRLNGKVVQKAMTSDLVFGGPAIVSFVSRFVTLMPGDIIYTGTPGATSKMSAGDVVEVEIEGVGVLRNSIVGAS